jgi:hypothetical protein
MMLARSPIICVRAEQVIRPPSLSLIASGTGVRRYGVELAPELSRFADL